MPEDYIPMLLQMLDSWEFGIFEAELITSHQPLRYIGHEIFKRHNLLTAHKVCVNNSVQIC